MCLFYRLGVRASRMVSSQVIDNDLNPKWNEDFKLLVHEPEHQASPYPLRYRHEYPVCVSCASGSKEVLCSDQGNRAKRCMSGRESLATLEGLLLIQVAKVVADLF